MLFLLINIPDHHNLIMHVVFINGKDAMVITGLYMMFLQYDDGVNQLQT